MNLARPAATLLIMTMAILCGCIRIAKREARGFNVALLPPCKGGLPQLGDKRTFVVELNPDRDPEINGV